MSTDAPSKRQRKRQRIKLRNAGVSPERIMELVPAPAPPNRHKATVWRQDPAEREAEKRRAAEYRARLEQETYERLQPDDRRHRPTSIDPLTKGAARATGATAKAIRRTKALTKFEYDQLEQTR